MLVMLSSIKERLVSTITLTWTHIWLKILCEISIASPAMLKAMIQQLSNDWDSMWNVLSVLLVPVLLFFFFFHQSCTIPRENLSFGWESQSCRGWLSLWVCYHENFCGWLRGGQWRSDVSRSSFPSYFDQMEEEPVWLSAVGRKSRKEGCGCGRQTFVEYPLCDKHLIRHFFVFLIFTVIKAGSYHPNFTRWGNFSGSEQVRLGWNSTLSTLSYYVQRRTVLRVNHPTSTSCSIMWTFLCISLPFFCLVNPITSLSSLYCGSTVTFSLVVWAH